MTEKQLIAKIRTLRQIEPSENWVVLTKERILGSPSQVLQNKILEDKEEPRFTFMSFLKKLQKGEKFIFQHKPVFATLLVGAVLIGLFGSVQKSVPGDTLYSLKKIAEKSQAVFVSQEEQPNYDFEMVQKRLDDLVKVAQKNSVKNLAPAINEYQTNVSKVAENIAKEKDVKKVKEMVLKMKELEPKEAEIKSFGIAIGGNEELDKTYAQKIIEMLEPLVKDLENRSLTEQQQEALTELEKDLADRNYEEALIKLLDITQ